MIEIVLLLDAPLKHSPDLQTALYVVVAEGVTVRVVPIAPVDQITEPTQPVAVSVTEPLAQILSVDAEITGGTIFGMAGNTTVIVAGPLGQTVPSQTAVYVPPADTVILEPVAPFDHLIVPVQPVALIVALTDVQVTLFEDVSTGVLLIDGCIREYVWSIISEIITRK